MRFNPVRPFLNAQTRPRAIIWLGMALIGFVLMWAGSLIGTSTEWFCTVPCHIVHDDNTAAYKASNHAKISCIACHEPVDASPYTFTMMKIHVLPDLPATIFNYFELPPNEFSHVALEMPSEQCTQCHAMDTRKVSASKGIVIDHDIHAENDVSCLMCHNRVAHPEEGIELILEGNRKHENWMTMDACFRCHGTKEYAKAPKTCSACHPKDFDLEPPSHDAKNWFTKFGDSKGHAQAALAEFESNDEALAEAKKAPELHGEEIQGIVLPPSNSVNSCYTCHEKKYCNDCHGTEIPHPASFKKEHAKAGYAAPEKCANCHARSKAESVGLGSCNACHHKASTPGQRWRYEHPKVVRKDGTKGCYSCHDERECSSCHVKVSEQGF